MTDPEFQHLVIQKLQSLEEGQKSLEVGQKTLEVGQKSLLTSHELLRNEFHEFRDDQKEAISALWSLSNQSFSATSDLQYRMTTVESKLDDIHREVVAPWKARKNA